MTENNKDIFEIVFLARGGQGAKTAAEILAQAAVSEGKFVQAFPNFGPERSGAPTKTYLKIGDKAIRSREPIIKPDFLVVLDDTLLESEEAKSLDCPKMLLNSAKKKEEVVKEIPSFSGEIFLLDANGISAEVIGQARPNTAILGKLIKIAEIVKLESVVSEFRRIFEEKIGKENCDKNVAAIEKAF